MNFASNFAMICSLEKSTLVAESHSQSVDFGHMFLQVFVVFRRLESLAVCDNVILGSLRYY